MEFRVTRFPGLVVCIPQVFGDKRGFFMESYSQRLFADQGIDTVFVQDNHARSVKKGVLRGVHFQAPPHAQAKLVRVTKGAALDVVVDLRKGSPTYGEWYAETLSDENFHQLFIPQGFAHAYMTLTDVVEFQYKTDNFYAPESEGGLIWNDPDIGIEWPDCTPVLSDKDLVLPRLRDFVSPFVFDG